MTPLSKRRQTRAMRPVPPMPAIPLGEQRGTNQLRRTEAVYMDLGL